MYKLFKPAPYLSAEMRENLNSYRYAGGDQGYAYIHFYNPVANYIVNFLPKTLA